MRENRTYGSYGEGLETDRGSHSAPRQPLTRQSLFARIERNLQSELASLGYPGAALFAFAVALVASNIFAVVKAALGAAQKRHESKAVSEMPLSEFAIVEDVRTSQSGMNFVIDALDAAYWQPFRDEPATRLAEHLRQWAAHADWRNFRKAVRSTPKVRRERTRFRNTPHVSTAKLLRRT